MKNLISTFVLLVCSTSLLWPEERLEVKESGIRIMQLMRTQNGIRRYPDALPSLLKMMNEQTFARFDTDPLYVSTLTDERLLENPILYVNCDDQPNLEFPQEERDALRRYMEQGGFVYLDAGIKASFLGSDLGHSYAAWEERPEVKEWFAQVFPEKTFIPLPRNHDLFRTFFKGLPKNDYLKIEQNQKRLPDTVLKFVEQEKWPQGTYSFVGMKVKGRLACVASPICAMGWGKDEFGAWIPPISFRIRESAENFDQNLKLASFSGGTFEVTREDGLKDVIYSEPGQRPVWVQEPTGRWRIFKYYSGEEISNYAHAFYSRLGMNVFLYALLN
ncbi:MAG: hypothetical protein CMI21_10330 [Opitutae bacterium]|nr:hypothetical protein [Opitutae bacterium]